ncbi:MAG: BON domain-containing protein [Anaerolineales bacterium]
MKTDIAFRIGDEVRCGDKNCGRLEKIILDPYTHRVVALVVSKGLLFRSSTVVPVSAVRRSHPYIELDLAPDKLAELPQWEAEAYTQAPEGWEEAGPVATSDMLLPKTAGGILHQQALRPSVRYSVQDEAHKEGISIRRGMRVVGKDGTIGRIDHVLANSETGEVTHLVVERGLLATRLIVPREMIAALSEDEVKLTAGEGELAALDRFRARDDEDILAEFRDKLAEIPFDADSIGIEIESGIVRLSGTVADVATKRHIEAVARSVNGVVDVVNGLNAATTLQSRVMAALAADPRTDLAIIDVAVQGSVVTLIGNVDSEEVKRAAEQIAEKQEGVTEVINHLEVKPDSDSTELRLRQFELAALARAQGSPDWRP